MIDMLCKRFISDWFNHITENTEEENENQWGIHGLRLLKEVHIG